MEHARRKPIYVRLYIVISVLGAYVIAGRLPWGSLTTGELSSLISYGINILSALMMLSMIIVIISMSAASAQRIAEVLREESAIITPEKPITEIEDGTIDFENVYFGYSGEGNYILEISGCKSGRGKRWASSAVRVRARLLSSISYHDYTTQPLAA